MSINELKHYGVKNMKWGHHKYSGGDASDNTTARPNNGKNASGKISDPTYNIFNAVGNIRKNVKKRANRDTIANKYVRRGINKTVKRIDLTGKRAGKSLTKYIDRNKKKKKVGFSTIGHWSEPMGVNELYHYGVKGMKWREHKRNYSDAEREILRKIKNEKNAIGEGASYAVGRSAEKRNAAAYSRGKRKRLRANAGRTRARQYGWGVRDHMYEISRKPVRHSDINELYHYGVKGMKWKHHKYSGDGSEPMTIQRRKYMKDGAEVTAPPTGIPKMRINNAVSNAAGRRHPDNSAYGVHRRTFGTARGDYDRRPRKEMPLDLRARGFVNKTKKKVKNKYSSIISEAKKKLGFVKKHKKR